MVRSGCREGLMSQLLSSAGGSRRSAVEWYLPLECGARWGGAGIGWLEVEVAAEFVGAGGQVAQAAAAASAGDAGAVVGDLDGEGAVGVDVGRDVGLGSAGVAGGVGEGFAEGGLCLLGDFGTDRASTA